MLIFIRHALLLNVYSSIHYHTFQFGWEFFYWIVVPLVAKSVISHRHDSVNYRREWVLCESLIELTVLLLFSASSERYLTTEKIQNALQSTSQYIYKRATSLGVLKEFFF